MRRKGPRTPNPARFRTARHRFPRRTVADSAASDYGWVEITVRVPQDEYVHPEIVRDDLLDVVPWTSVTAFVADTSPGYEANEVAP